MSLTMLPLESTGCGTFQPTVSYPERSGRMNLMGSLKDYSAGFVKDARVTLNVSGARRGRSAGTNENGEFQFADIAPGRYTLKVTPEGYEERSVMEFWVTRENLTALTPICVFRKINHPVIFCQ